MVITGAEWERFWQAIGDDWHVDNHDLPDDSETASWFAVTCGMLCFQGSRTPGTHPVFNRTEIDDGCADLLVVFRRWQKRQRTATIVVECDKDRTEELKRAVVKCGGKIVK